jgi:mutator protein MutT
VKVVQVAAGLIFRQGTLLITQRHAHDHLGGLWEFPGGKCELGESYPDALHRELREELGIEVTVLERFESIDHAYPDRAVHLEFFVCRWLAREPQALGCAQFRWIQPQEFDHYPFPAADARLLERLRTATDVWRVGTPRIASLHRRHPRQSALQSRAV